MSELVAFARSFDPLPFWGSPSRVASVAASVLPGSTEARARSTSVLKLRTALAWLVDGGQTRSTTSDGISFGTDSLSAPLDGHFAEIAARDLIYFLRLCLVRERLADTLFGHAVSSVGSAIPSGAFTKRDLADRLRREVDYLWDPELHHVPWSATEVDLGSLPGWMEDDLQGTFDISFGVEDWRGEHPQSVVETVWGDQDDTSESFWDTAKLVAALAAHVDHAYLVGGWPTQVWRRSVFAELYDDGVVDFPALMSHTSEGLDRQPHAFGTAVAIPNCLRIHRVGTARFVRDGEAWELRAASIEPDACGWTMLDGGLIQAQDKPNAIT